MVAKGTEDTKKREEKNMSQRSQRERRAQRRAKKEKRNERFNAEPQSTQSIAEEKEAARPIWQAQSMGRRRAGFRGSRRGVFAGWEGIG